MERFGSVGDMKIENNKKGGMRMKAAMKSKTEKASTCFTRLYGRAAYEAWKAREAEIDELMRQHACGTKELAALREDNYRRMKQGQAGIIAAPYHLMAA